RPARGGPLRHEHRWWGGRGRGGGWDGFGSGLGRLPLGTGQRFGRVAVHRVRIQQARQPFCRFLVTAPALRDVRKQLEPQDVLGVKLLADIDRKSTRLNSSHGSISYAVL